MIKKIITAALAVTLTVGVAVTSAMAATYQHKNEAYSHTETGNEMKTMISGSTTGASTQASNSTGKYSRYIAVCVMEKNALTNATIKSNDATITTTNAGTGCGISRDYDNSYLYYVHQSLMTPGQSISFTIDSTYNIVRQES